MKPMATSHRVPRLTTATGSGRRIAAAMASLIAVVLGVSACGSSSPSTATSTTAPAGSTSSPGSASSSTTTSSQPATASLAKIESKLSAGQSASFVATYSVKSTTSGVSNSINFTVGHAGKSTVFSIAEPQGSFEEIDAHNIDTWCAKSAGSWKCYTGSLGATIGTALNVFLSDFSESATLARLEAAKDDAYDVSTSSTTIDGRPVTCVTYHAHVDSGVYTICVTVQGILARVVGVNAQEHFTVALTGISTTVPSNEFTPPATPTTIP
jgi:hypothetical protein